MTPSNNNIYVANYDSGMVIVIDPSSNNIVNDVVVNYEPTALAIAPLTTISTWLIVVHELCP
jgi:YVTN family beta-propeller protein